MTQRTCREDLSRSLAAFDQANTLLAVVEMGSASWLVAGMIPGVARQPKKKLDPEALLRLLARWRAEAVKAGRPIVRTTLAFEAGRDGFWLARWLAVRNVEPHVIHSTSVAVSREKRRAKTDRVDAEMLMRVFVGWLRGERGHCSMVAVPTRAQEDARRPGRAREALVGARTRIINRLNATMAWLGIRCFKPRLRKAPAKLDDLRSPEGAPIPPNTLAEIRREMVRLETLRRQIAEIEAARRDRIAAAPDHGAHATIAVLARGIGIETADLLVNEVIVRRLRDRRAVARYAGITGSPDESATKRREKGLSKAGNPRVRRAMIELAWRWTRFQKQSALTRWFKSRTEGAPGLRKKMIVALARKLLLALWRFANTGEIPEGTLLRPAA